MPEADVSGVRQNMIPKQGGGTFHGALFGTYTNDSLASTSNVSNPGLVTVDPKIWDLNPTFGGPVKEDRLWYFGAYRYWGDDEHPPGSSRVEFTLTEISGGTRLALLHSVPRT